MNIDLFKLILLRVDNPNDMYKMMSLNSRLFSSLDKHFWRQKLALPATNKAVSIIYPPQTPKKILIAAYYNRDKFNKYLNNVINYKIDKSILYTELFSLDDFIFIEAVYKITKNFSNKHLFIDNYEDYEILLNIKNLTQEKMEFLERLNPIFTNYLILLYDDNAYILMQHQSREFYRYCIVDRALPFGNDALSAALKRNEPLEFYEFLFSLPEVWDTIEEVYMYNTQLIIDHNRLDLFQFFDQKGIDFLIDSDVSFKLLMKILNDEKEFPMLDYLWQLEIYPSPEDLDTITNIALLEWLKSGGIWPDEEAVNHAILTNNTAAMAWFLQEEIYPTKAGADQAIREGNIAALDYMANLLIFPTQDAIRIAKYHNQDESVKWLRVHGYAL